MECIFTAYFNWYPVCLIYFLFQQGTMECILTAALTGVLFALFSGQPLNILGSTGPMLVLEMIIYNLWGNPINWFSSCHIVAMVTSYMSSYFVVVFKWFEDRGGCLFL
jgi:hypothetical protein